MKKSPTIKLTGEYTIQDGVKLTAVIEAVDAFKAALGKLGTGDLSLRVSGEYAT